MIRKILIFTVLAVTAAVAIVLPLSKSDAAQQPTSAGSPQGSAVAPCQTLTFARMAGASLMT